MSHWLALTHIYKSTTLKTSYARWRHWHSAWCRIPKSCLKCLCIKPKENIIDGAGSLGWKGQSKYNDQFFTSFISYKNRVLLRVILFYGTKQRIVIHPTHFARDDEDHKVSLATLDPRIGVPSSSTLYGSASRKGWAHVAELLWILRPLIYGMIVWWIIALAYSELLA